MNNNYTVPASEICVDNAIKAIVVTQPSHIMPELRLAMAHHLTDQEMCFVVTLNGANVVLGMHMVSLGQVNACMISPQIVFKHAIMDNAVSIIIAHNHPSGTMQASKEDLSITRILGDSGKILGIPVLDHLIVGEFGFKSIRGTNPELF